MNGENQNQSAPPEKQEPTLEEKLKKCEQERDEYLNGWKRAKADLINYQRDEARRMEEMVKFGNESVLRDLIAIMDSFDLAVAVEKEDKGLVLIRSQLEGMLKQYGLEPIKALHEKFNPAFHEVMAEVESENEPGTVVEEVARGWKLYEKVVRPARVKVAKERQVTSNK